MGSSLSFSLKQARRLALAAQVSLGVSRRRRSSLANSIG